MNAGEWTELQNASIVQYLAAELLSRLEAKTVPTALRGTPTLRRVRHALRDLGEELGVSEVELVKMLDVEPEQKGDVNGTTEAIVTS